MSLVEALGTAERELAAAGVPDPRVDAEWIVAHAAGVRRSALALDGDVDAARVEELVARRARREPLAYVLGEWSFRRLTLTTDRRALVPRPETEVVVERCLDLLRGVEAPRVLDVGTGSGAIALALTDEHPRARVTGIDTSGEALELARENAQRLGLGIDLRLGGAAAASEGWDLVVSNPPYVRREELDGLEPEIREWEPLAALLDTGLHEEIARCAQTRWLVLEAGDGQASGLAATLAELGYDGVRITADLSGRERVVEGRR